MGAHVRRTSMIFGCIIAMLPSVLSNSDMFNGEYTCRDPTKIDYSTYNISGTRQPNGRFNDGTKVTYTCDENYTKGLDSSSTATCRMGWWQGANNFRCCLVPICIDPNLHCTLSNIDGVLIKNITADDKFLLPLSRSYVLSSTGRDYTFDFDISYKYGYGVGTNVTYGCRSGSKLHEDTTYGPFTCMNGGKWLPKKITKCNWEVCPEPPKIENGRLAPHTGGRPFKFGMKVYYQCDPGYDINPRSYLVCTSKLQWEASGEIESIYNFPKCTKIINNESCTSLGGPSKSNDHKTVTAKKEPWNPLKTIFTIIVILFALGLCACALMSNSGGSLKSRAVNVEASVTTIQFVGPNTYAGPPPTLTTGSPLFNPCQPTMVTYAPNYGSMAPPEMISLAPQLPTKPDAAPPNYEHSMLQNRSNVSISI